MVSQGTDIQFRGSVLCLARLVAPEENSRIWNTYSAEAVCDGDGLLLAAEYNAALKTWRHNPDAFPPPVFLLPWLVTIWVQCEGK